MGYELLGGILGVLGYLFIVLVDINFFILILGVGILVIVYKWFVSLGKYILGVLVVLIIGMLVSLFVFEVLVLGNIFMGLLSFYLFVYN